MSGLAWPSAYPGVVTQRFGIVALANEPAGYSDGKRAASTSFPGSAYGAHVHRGLDIRAYEGTPLYAAEAGTVIKASTFANGELYMQLRISPTTVLQYDHCSAFVAAVGQNVARGQVIAKAGSTGNVTAAHLHFEVQITDGATVYRWDPALFLEALGGTWGVQPGGDVNPKLDLPVAVADVSAGTPVIDATTGATLLPSWNGGSDIGLYSRGGGNAAIRIDLGAGGSDLHVAYVKDTHISNVRLPGSTGGAGQAELDAATAAGFADAKAKALTAVGSI